MNKYVIYHDAGFGRSCEVVEAESHDDAEKMAYEAWREEVEYSADYDVREYTEEDEQHEDEHGEVEW